MVCDTISEMKTNEGDIVSMKPGDQPTVSCRRRCRCYYYRCCRCSTSLDPNHIPTPNPQGLTWDEVGVSVNQWAPKESETQAASATGDIKSASGVVVTGSEQSTEKNAEVGNGSATRQTTPVITRKQKVSARLFGVLGSILTHLSQLHLTILYVTPSQGRDRPRFRVS